MKLGTPLDGRDAVGAPEALGQMSVRGEPHLLGDIGESFAVSDGYEARA
jgi:hypothetical protein